MSSFLNDPALLRGQAFINGVWCDADDGGRFDVANPASGAVLGQVPAMGGAETARAIAAANAALPAWKARTAKDRAALMMRWHDLILAAKEDLARLLTLEQGKPLDEARGEIGYGLSFIEWFAQEARRVYGDIVPTHKPGARLLVLKEAVGVVGAITPWNFPNAMITRKIAPALAAGCTVVLKPAESTPLSALALAVLAERAGFPAGTINIVTGDPAGIGRELTASPIVRKLSFTGSTRVGKLLMGQSADTVKKLSLELGGNSPFIVFDDANLDTAIAGAMASKYRNAGQTCVCTNRFYVQDGIYDAFVDRLVAAAEALTVGDGCQPGIQQGPMINAAAIAKVQELIADAVAKGARVLTGGSPHALGGCFFQPTVIVDVTPEMRLAREEIFGPVAAIQRFQDEGDVVARANDTEYGLAAYFYSRKLARIWRVAEALEYGMVGVNEGLISTESAPFGGVKQSGLGREGSKYGIDEYLETKYLCLGLDE
ncbi:succinate-semialdehyde dehydrogenase [Niveispirillum sp. SYP-B3756]|uniref:NAD-dependent succinate-semialdehyde dehydrogenase n=1 Tax=Niveispirillum sp. SYP-B3756 TaxID=2662178 RepID=UPI001290E5F7|nr:NAD-dependent succinate-semialdehyde dehydrogenase [Niveispirillum sp. SYP-B3756]MQP67256.1 succinate-semialdehyde dehydrogenase [Niveispirillum sp. SYP-B3756]